MEWKLALRDVSSRWNLADNLVVQLGDASYPFLPISANGATQALEDSIYLASCLYLTGRGDIPLAEMSVCWITDHDREEYVYRNRTKCVDCVLGGTDVRTTDLPIC